MSAIDWPILWKVVSDQFLLGHESLHGPAHWRRVEQNGLLLATRSGADVTVVQLFAIFHDSRRENEGSDLEHGERGAKLATQMRGKYFEMEDAAFDKLIHACTWHTTQRHHSDPTIGTCYDADRLDLGRVMIIPHPDFMNTEFGREIAKAGSIHSFLPKSNKR